MFFNTEITDTLEIRTKKQARKIIQNYIEEFFYTEKGDDVWGQLTLLFKDHQEVYDIDDSYDDLMEEENNPFKELRKEIIAKDLIGSIYIHYEDEDDDTTVTCGISSIFLNNYIEGYKSNDDESVAFSEEDPNDRLIGEPFEITGLIDYYKGCQYSDELVKNFNIYMGEEDAYSHFPVPMTLDLWGQCHVFSYDPESIFRLFNKKVKNDYVFYVLDSGEIVITTALSYKHNLKDSSFVRECIKRGKEMSETIFQTGLYYKGEYLFACYSEMSVINALKLFNDDDPNKEENLKIVPGLMRANISMALDYIEKYCNEVCGKSER